VLATAAAAASRCAAPPEASTAAHSSVLEPSWVHLELSCPQQGNSSDCGVFCVLFMQALSHMLTELHTAQVCVSHVAAEVHLNAITDAAPKQMREFLLSTALTP
jgi:hypothetical protein